MSKGELSELPEDGVERVTLTRLGGNLGAHSSHLPLLPSHNEALGITAGLIEWATG